MPIACPVPARATLAVAILLVNAMLPVADPADCGAKVAVKFALCPGDSVTGTLIPLVLNPAPAAVALVIVTALPPELVTAPVWFCVLPTVTLPKPMVLGLKVSAPGGTAVPVMAIARLGFVAVETIDKLPLSVPAAMGAKVRSKFALCPAARVRGNASPLIVKPDPVTLAWEIVAPEPPEFVKVTVCFCELPTVTLPNDTLAGTAANCPAAVPSPETDKATLVAEVFLGPEAFAKFVAKEAVPFTVMLPLTGIGVFGEKVTVKAALCPGASVTGKVNPLTVKAALLTEFCETVTLLPPAFVSVTDFAWLCPTGTLPKISEPGVTVNLPAATAFPLTDTSISAADEASLRMATLPVG